MSDFAFNRPEFNVSGSVASVTASDEKKITAMAGLNIKIIIETVRVLRLMEDSTMLDVFNRAERVAAPHASGTSSTSR